MLKFHIFIFLTCEESVRIRRICEELVRFFSDVKNWYSIGVHGRDSSTSSDSHATSKPFLSGNLKSITIKYCLLFYRGMRFNSLCLPGLFCFVFCYLLIFVKIIFSKISFMKLYMYFQSVKQVGPRSGRTLCRA